MNHIQLHQKTMRNPFLPAPTKSNAERILKSDILLTANYTTRIEVCADVAQKASLCVISRKDLFRQSVKKACKEVESAQTMILTLHEKHLAHKLEFVTETADLYAEQIDRPMAHLKDAYYYFLRTKMTNDADAKLLSQVMMAQYFLNLCVAVAKGELHYVMTTHRISPYLSTTQSLMNPHLQRLASTLKSLSKVLAKVMKCHDTLQEAETPLVCKWQKRLQELLMDYMKVADISKAIEESNLHTTLEHNE